MIYDRDSNAFLCNRCGDVTPISRESFRNPERYVELSEMYSIQHENCKPRPLQVIERERVWDNSKLIDRAKYVLGGAA